MKLFLPLLLCCFVLTAGSFSSQAQDYTITTTGNAIVITDNSGNGETLTVSQSGSNIRFAVTPNTRTYSINGGPTTAFTTFAEVALSGITSITINTTAGNDNINVGAFMANLPSLTINGGTGDDQVNFNGDISFAVNANLDVDMQNDDATPGVDQVTVATNANLLLTGTGTATVKVSRDVLINSGGSIETADGNLTLAANQQAMPSSGNFVGVELSGGILKISGIGLLDVKGKGGNSDDNFNVGVFVFNAGNAGKIEGGSGTVTVQGTGGAAAGNNNYGVWVIGTNSRITSSGGAVSVTGQGGGSGTSISNLGVLVQSVGEITAGGSGTVTVQGSGGAASGNLNHGVFVASSARITSSGGAVIVTGQGGGTGTSEANRGVSVESAGQITAGGSGTVTVQGTGGAASGNDNYGVYVFGANTRITSSGGAVSVTGQGGFKGASASNHGVFVNSAGEITADGSGTVTVQGTGGAVTVQGNFGAAWGDFNYGVYVIGTNSRITSSGGAVSVTGQGGGTRTSEFNYGVTVQSAGQITAGGSGTVTVQGTGGAAAGDGNYGVYVVGTNSRITSSGGAVSVTGKGGGSTRTSRFNYGVFVKSTGQITAGGSGTVTVQGTGGAASGSFNLGVYVLDANSRITSSGGAVSVTGIEGGGSTGIGFVNNSSGTVTTAVNGGNISIMAKSMSITAPVSTNASSSVTLKPFSSGVAIDLGSTSDPIGGPLVLSDAELDLISTGTLIIGDATAGNIMVSLAISFPAATNVQLRSGGDITFNQNFNTSGGTLLLAPGNTPAAVKPTFTGTDATASTVSFASDLSIAINGTTPGDGTGSTFTRLTVAGSVDLTGVDLVFSGAYLPVLGNTFTIVDNDGTDAIVNTFTGLVEGARISNFLGSGLDATITYLGGDGNDVVLTVVAAPLPDYTITTTGNEIVITDISGNGETLTVSESGSNIRFEVSPNTRTYRINGGAITAFTTPADVALAGATAITINTAAGNDVINMAAFAANLPSLTINGGTGDDQVFFTGDIPFAANASLDVDMQNDAAAPGVDRVTVAANANLILTGTGTATVKVSRDVLINSGGSIETAEGNLTVEANQQAMPSSGNFVGVRLNGGVLKINGTGLLEVKGKGGNSGGNNRGVVVDNAGKIEGGSGTVTVQGTGGEASGNGNFGVYFLNANTRITSSGGPVSVTGQGGGTGASASNYGVWVSSAGEITAGGSGTVTVQGTGGAASGNSNIGVYVLSAGSRITSSGGAVSVTGIEGGGSTGIGFFNSSSGTVTTAVNGGNISIIANRMNITAPVSTNASSSVTLKPFSSGIAIDLGSTSNPIGGPLGLSDAELDLISTGTLIIGDANSGAINISNAISRPASTAMQLITGADITFDQGINTAGGNLLLDGGTAPNAIRPSFNGTDATVGTLSFGSPDRLGMVINGTAIGNGTGNSYTQLNVAGMVNLAGVELAISGTYVPVVGNVFTILENDGTDAIVGTFTGLPEGTEILNFLGNPLKRARISYLGGTGNDVVITVFEPDYSITTTGGNLVITDNSGNSETLNVSQNGSNIRFAAPVSRTYSINGGATTAFGIPANVALSGITSITINTAAGDDIINLGAFTVSLPSITINGGTGNNAVNLNGNIAFGFVWLK